jgi:hypothetical protein
MRFLIRFEALAFIVTAMPLDAYASDCSICQGKEVLMKCLKAADQKGLNWNCLIEGEGRYVLKENYEIRKGRSLACSKNPPYIYKNIW